MTGTWTLLGLAIRRDRWTIIGWFAVLVLTTASSAKATLDLYADPAAAAAAARAVNSNAALVAMYGPIWDEHSIGALAIFKLLLLFGALMCILFVVLVRRHTRLEEESGRADLVWATAVGEHAPVSAALLQSTGLAVLLGVLVAVGNIATGLPAAGSFAFGLGWSGLALVAVALTAVAAQVFGSARTVSGVVAAVLGASYVVRAVADAARIDWLVWASPFGWVSRMRAYSDERWWPLGLLLLTYVVGVALAFWLRSRRDLGSGLVSSKPGPATGRLRSIAGLTARLHRSGLVGWCLAMVGLGVVLGAIAPSAAEFAGTAPVQDMLRRMGGPGALKDTFLAIETSFMAVAAAAYAISVVARAAGEEESGRTATVLAAGVSRTRVFVSVVGYAVVAATLLLASFGVAAGVAFGQAEGDLSQVWRLTAAALGQSPAVWTLVGLSALAFGVRAAWASWGWILLIGSVVIGQIGEPFNLPEWLINASPFAHIPRMPAEDFDLSHGVLALVAVAAVSLGLGWLAYQRRDITG